MSYRPSMLDTQRNIYIRNNNPLGTTTTIGRAFIGSGLTSYLFSEQAKQFLKISLIVLIVVIIGIALYYYFKSYEKFENPNDTDRVKAQKKSRVDYVKNIVNSVSTLQLDPIDVNMVKLVNLQMPCTKQAGFMGPYTDGVFDESESVLNQLKMNIRTFFLQIDYINSDKLSKDKFPNKLKPSLFYTDKNGAINSYNSSDIGTLFSYIKEFSFNDNAVNNKNDPVLILLHFVKLPYNTSQIEEYTKYLGIVSDALSVLGNNMLSGGFYRSEKEKELFSTKFKDISQKIIVGTNIDTSVFTKSTLVNTSKDLNYKIHFHYWVKGEEKVDATSKTNDLNKHAFIYNSSTLLNMDDTAKENWKLENKGKFIIVKTPNNTDLSQKNMDKLLNDFGVNIINYNFFNEVDLTKQIRKLYGYQKIKPVFLQLD